MAYDFRYPVITGASEKEQLTQMKSYLHQLVQQLNYSLNDIDKVQIQYIKSPVKNESSKKEDEKGTQATFDALKPLIIKSAEIVEAYYEQINERLEGLYVAQSDFGTFTEHTSQNITKNSTEIEQAFTNIQTIDTGVKSIDENVWKLDAILDEAKKGVETSLQALSDDIGQLDSGIQAVADNASSEIQKLKEALDATNYSLIEVNARIKAGLLDYENEIPIFGLEVGQTNIIDGVEVFRKYARFTANRLSFYDQNDIEVAYISDYKLHITNAEITGTLKLGAFLIDTSNGLRLKFVKRR